MAFEMIALHAFKGLAGESTDGWIVKGEVFTVADQARFDQLIEVGLAQDSALPVPNTLPAVREPYPDNLNTIFGNLQTDIDSVGSEVTGARDDGNGTVYNDLAERLNMESADVNSKLADVANNFKGNQNDIRKLHSLIKSGEGIRYAILGDSTEAGVGQTGAGSYGEANHVNSYSGQVAFALSMIVNDENFMPVDKNAGHYSEPLFTTSTVSFCLPHHKLVVSQNPTLNYSAKQNGAYKYDKLTIYYIERTSTGAPTFDVVCNGVTTTIDTYAPAINYDGDTYNINPRVAKKTIPIPAQTDISFIINNVTGRSGGDGTAMIFGFTLGNGVDVKNFAVSSTTLLNNSGANQTRGVTTTERLQKAYDFGANVISMGWGTNDSKVGVSNVEVFKADLETRIDEIRAVNPETIIVLNTDPKGVAGSIYENNPPFNQAIREVALKKNVSLLDVESIFEGTTGLYADDVHPNQLGYTVIGKALATAFNFAFVFKEKTLVSTLTAATNSEAVFNQLTLPEPLSDKTGIFVEMGSILMNRPTDKFNLRVEALVNLADSVDIASSFRLRLVAYPNVNGSGVATETFVDEKYITAFSSSGTRSAIVNMKALWNSNSYLSYKVMLEGKNFTLKQSEAQSKLFMEFF